MKSIKNKYLFFLTRTLKDVFNPTVWPISQDKHSSNLGEYYFVFSEEAIVNQKGGQKSIIYDDEGIPMNPTYIDVKDKDAVYFPITIGQTGLAVFNTWLKSGTDKDKERFLKFPRWFEEHGEDRGEKGIIWMTDVSLPQYKNPGPWQSAFVQSRGISNLLRGWQITGNKKWLEMAERALIPYTISVDDGGVTSFSDWGPFYEEYTAEVPTLVLNGMIFALCGIMDFVRVFPENTLAKGLLEDGLETLRNVLPEFDAGFWSKYNLCKAPWYAKVDLATITYQHLHITQLTMLYEFSGDDIFHTYAEKFKKQLTPANALRMYFSKYRSLKSIGRI